MGLFDNFFNKQTPTPKPTMVEEDFSLWPMKPGQSKYNKSLPREFYNTRYVWYGQDNLYPNRLNELYESSAIHSAIIDFKKSMISGGGYDIEMESDALEHIIGIKQMESGMYDGTSLQDFIDEITMDYLIHAVVYIKLYWNHDRTKILSCERIEPSKIRVGVDTDYEKVDRFYYSFDWYDTGRFRIKDYPAYSRNSKNKCEIWRIVKKSPVVKWYSFPQYASAANWIELDARISLFHKSSIENGSNPGKFLVFTEKPGSPEAKRKIMEKYTNSYTGEETTNKTMVLFVDGRENIPEFRTIEPTALDKQYHETAEQALRNICHAHRINPIIMGIKTSHSLGNPKELLNAFEIFKKVVIEPSKSDIERILNNIFDLKGIPAKIKLREVELDLHIDERSTVVATQPENKIIE